MLITHPTPGIEKVVGRGCRIVTPAVASRGERSEAVASEEAPQTPVL